MVLETALCKLRRRLSLCSSLRHVLEQIGLQLGLLQARDDISCCLLPVSESRLQQLLGDLQTVHLHTRLRQEPMWDTTKEKLPNHGESAVQPYKGLLPNAHFSPPGLQCADVRCGKPGRGMNDDESSSG